MFDRFRYESSVPDALAFGSGEISNWNMSVAISAAMKSKWVNTTWPQAVPQTIEGPGYQHMQAPFQPAMPMSNPPPMPFGYQNMAPSHAPYSTMPGFGTMLPTCNIYCGHPGCLSFPAYPVLPAPPLLADPFACIPPPVPGSLTSAYDGQLHHLSRATEHRPVAEPPAAEQLAPCAPTSVQQQQAAPKTTKTQSKPPCEEALYDLSRQGNASVTTPELSGATASPTKARVLLPTASPVQPTTPTMANKGGPKKHEKQTHGVPVETEHGQGHQDKKRAASGAAPGTPTPKQKRSKEPQADLAKDTATSIDDANKTTEGSQDEQPPTTVGASKDPASALPEGKEATEPSAAATQRRTPSMFTEDQIRDRKRAWDRIPMPLNPLKAKKPTDGSSGPSQPQVAENKASMESQQTTGSELQFVRWVEARTANKKGKTEGEEAPVKRADAAKSRLLDHASSSGPSKKGIPQPTESSSDLRPDSLSAQWPADPGSMAAQRPAPMSLSTLFGGPAAPARGRGHFRQQSRGRRHFPSQPVSGRSSRQSSHSNQGGVPDGGHQAAHSRHASQSGTGDVDVGLTAADGRGSVRKNRNKKKKNKSQASSAFVSPQDAPQAHQQHGGSAPGQASLATGQGGYDVPSHIAVQPMPRPGPGPMGPPTELPIRTRNFPSAGEQASRPAQVIRSQGQASGSMLDRAQPQQSRQHYRADAGGSLRMGKNRRQRLHQQLFDAPSVAESAAEQHAGTETSAPHTPIVAQSFIAGVQQDITSPRGGRPRQSSGDPGSGSKAILLNPRAEVFVSPQMRAAKVAEKEAGTTEGTTGEKSDGELTAQDGQAQHAAAPSAATPSSGSLLQTRTTDDFTVVEWPSRPGQETSLSRSPTAQSQENASDEASRTLSAAGSPDRDEAGGPEGKDGGGE